MFWKFSCLHWVLKTTGGRIVYQVHSIITKHTTKKPLTTMLTYPCKCTVLHCNHLGNTWKPLVLMTRHFDYCPSASEGDNQSVRSSAPVVSRCFPGGYNVKLYISRGRLAWWLLAFLHSENNSYPCTAWSRPHLDGQIYWLQDQPSSFIYAETKTTSALC